MYKCKLCSGEAEKMVDLGTLPLASDFLDPANPEEKWWYRGVWTWCDTCQMLQLDDPPPIDLVYTKDYQYLSGMSKYMDWHFKRTARELVQRYSPRNVIEIASNDGGIVQFIKDRPVLGVDPMDKACEIMAQKDVPYRHVTFTKSESEKIVVDSGKYDLVFMSSTIRSLPDLDDLFTGFGNILADGGVLVIEEPYIVNILNRNEWDQLFSENVWGLTISSMDSLARRYGLRLIDVDPLPDNHGGSLRYHLVKESDYRIRKDTVDEYAKIIGEPQLGERLRKWQARIDRNVDDFAKEIGRGRRVIGYAATARSITVMNYAQSRHGKQSIECIYDTTPSKVGTLIPGVHVPIRNAKLFNDDPADLVILWANNKADEIIARERDREWLLLFPVVHRRTK